MLPRGNWKTSTSALIGLHHLLRVEHASVALAAGSREQARIAGAILSAHARAFPALVLRHDEVRAPSGLLRVIAADGGRAHGRTDTLMIGDEVWSGPEREPSLLNAFETALVKIPTARLLLISTSAAQLDSPLGRMWARALAGEVKRSGAFIDAPAEGLRWLEWSVPESHSLRSDHAVKLANPAPTITPGSLREQRERVTELAFAQFHACRWGVSEAQWLPPGAWSACRDDFEVEEGEPPIAGIDIGGSRAASALVAVTEDLRVAHVEVFQGEQSVLAITEALIRLAERHPITEAAYDPRRFQSEALRLERDHRLVMVSFPQSHARMVPASEPAALGRRGESPAPPRRAGTGQARGRCHRQADRGAAGGLRRASARLRSTR